MQRKGDELVGDGYVISETSDIRKAVSFRLGTNLSEKGREWLWGTIRFHDPAHLFDAWMDEGSLYLELPSGKKVELDFGNMHPSETVPVLWRNPLA